MKLQLLTAALIFAGMATTAPVIAGKPKTASVSQSGQRQSVTDSKDQIRLTRVTPEYWRVTFHNPPYNIYGPGTMPQLNEVVTAIDTLLDEHTPAEIAEILNQRGVVSGMGQPFHRLIVWNIMREYRLRDREQRLRDAGMLTLAEISEHLNVHPLTVKRWRRASVVTGHPYNDKGECLYPVPTGEINRPTIGRPRSERRRR